jgi:hypothetical protein
MGLLDGGGGGDAGAAEAQEAGQCS